MFHIKGNDTIVVLILWSEGDIFYYNFTLVSSPRKWPDY